MKVNSTRNIEHTANFATAITKCMPDDGGLYEPSEAADLRRWILYTNENTPFPSIAGALTSAFIKEEFSPIICETIATRAFPFTPRLNKLSDNLFTLELFHTPTGSHKDFGISFLINSLEVILTMQGKDAIFLDVTMGELGASVAKMIQGKKHVKSVLIYPKGRVRGLKESDYIWNGGNILPVEVDGNEKDCHKLIRKIFFNHEFVEKYGLTTANTANIGRLMPQMFFYPFAFSRLKNQVNGDIYYSMATGNFSNLVAGLYSWRVALPVNGFICPATNEITTDLKGNCMIMDSLVELKNREKADPANPSNIERLESMFNSNSLLLKHFIFPATVTEELEKQACQELFMKYNVYADKLTSRAYAATLAQKERLQEDDASVVLIMRDHPSLSSEYIKHNVGETPEMPENMKQFWKSVQINRPVVSTAEEIMELIKKVKQNSF
ncbi:pyridoxal-phosphate dependent enzyme [Treponema zioleckii]|uniref:pyridoxal-phosphate dependent enzyme n=1 Tax=Treponema zioleckii TaxID=331680 RepID=UPI00168B3667|nr:pyridoxal-phosphate dependent enzyme [Treponema zioleckii]